MKNAVTEKQGQNLPLQVNVISREKMLYKGVATTISSENERGPFDVLSGHANFISLINTYVIIDKGLPTEQSFQLDKGVIYVASNKVDVYVGI